MLSMPLWLEILRFHGLLTGLSLYIKILPSLFILALFHLPQSCS